MNMYIYLPILEKILVVILLLAALASALLAFFLNPEKILVVILLLAALASALFAFLCAIAFINALCLAILTLVAH